MSAFPAVIEWIDASKERPPACVGILFTDGQEVYFGWLETWDTKELPSWYDCEGKEYNWPDNITHWAYKPSPPEVIEKNI